MSTSSTPEQAGAMRLWAVPGRARGWLSLAVPAEPVARYPACGCRFRRSTGQTIAGRLVCGIHRSWERVIAEAKEVSQ